MECDDRIEYEKEDDEYYELSHYDDEMHNKFIREYDEKTFFDELINHLSQRDSEKDIKKFYDFESKYADEFERNGLTNLKVNFKK